MRIGFIGLGSQGGPMARRIVEAGYPTTLWARRPDTLEPFADTAAKVAASPAELAAASDLVCLCVVGDADIEEITGGEHGVLAGLKPGSVIAVHSTVHPDTCKELAKKAVAQGVSVVDAPVSGGGPAAAEGRLLVMVGGDGRRCRALPSGLCHLRRPGRPSRRPGLRANHQAAEQPVVHREPGNGGRRPFAGQSPRRRARPSHRGRLAQQWKQLRAQRDWRRRRPGPNGRARREHCCSKDVRLVVDLADQAATRGGAVLDAADAALAQMGHPR